jgi:hypothetical protein
LKQFRLFPIRPHRSCCELRSRFTYAIVVHSNLKPLLSTKKPSGEGQPEPAFTASRSIARFVPEECLRFEGGGRFAVVKGTLEGQPALVQLEQLASVS